jgi:hypothetical protein
MAKISIQVVKKDKQSSAAVFSEYVKKARTFGASKVLRKRKFFTRTLSDTAIKEAALKKIEKIATNDRLRKLGKM